MGFLRFLLDEFLKDIDIRKEMEFWGIAEAPEPCNGLPVKFRAKSMEELKKILGGFGGIVQEDEHTIKFRVFSNSDQFVVVYKIGHPVNE